MGRKKKHSFVTVRETPGEARIYFLTEKYSPTKEQLVTALNATTFHGLTTGGELDRYRYGEVRIYFNPLYHGAGKRSVAIEKVIQAITTDENVHPRLAVDNIRP